MQLSRDIVSVAFRNLKREGTRTFLTLIGVIIGIAAIVSLISLGNGLSVEVERQFESLGTNTIFIIPGASQMGLGRITLTESDISKIENTSGVESVIPIYSKSASFEYNGQKINVSVNAVDSQKASIFESSNFLEVGEGRMLTKNDSAGVLVGNTLAKDYFDKEIQLRKKILIDGVEYQVVGILKPQQTSFGGGPSSGGTVYMTLDAYRRIVPSASLKPGIIFAQSTSADNTTEVAEKIKEDLEKKYGEKSVLVSSSEQLLTQVQSILGLLTIFVAGIGAVSLLVGGIGIMNAMVTSVMERTREIGVLKALGASNETIRAIFLLEAGFIGMVGGIVGILFGFGMALVVSLVGQSAGFGLNAYYGLDIALGALIFSMIIGILSGVLPAITASNLDPVVALRYE